MSDGYAAAMAAISGGKAVGLALDDVEKGLVPDLEGHAVRIEYRDSAGRASARWVTIHRIELGPPAILHAYCWVRRMSRTFRADRVSEVSGVYGECWPAERFFAAFGVSVKAGSKAGSGQDSAPIRSLVNEKPGTYLSNASRKERKKAKNRKAVGSFQGAAHGPAASGLAGLAEAEARLAGPPKKKSLNLNSTLFKIGGGVIASFFAVLLLPESNILAALLLQAVILLFIVSIIGLFAPRLVSPKSNPLRKDQAFAYYLMAALYALILMVMAVPA